MHPRSGSSLPPQFPDTNSEVLFAVDPTLHDDVLQECLIKAIDGIGLADIEVLFAHQAHELPYLCLDLSYLPICFRCSGPRRLSAALLCVLGVMGSSTRPAGLVRPIYSAHHLAW